jgi:hypothetical protein
MRDRREPQPPMHPAPLYLLGAVIDAICDYDVNARKTGAPTFPVDAIKVVRDAFKRETEAYYAKADKAEKAA